MGEEISCYETDGWRSIESFIYRHIVSPDNRNSEILIAGEFEQQLKSDAVMDLLRGMGLLSVGYLFAGELEKTLYFFRGGEKQSQHYRTPYLWKDQDGAARFSKLIHSLFVNVREEQRSRLKTLGYHFEEYYVYLPQIRSKCPSPERAYYCPIGELLFWLYTWRLLCFFGQLVSPNGPFECGQVFLSNALPDRTKFTWWDLDIASDDFTAAINALDLVDWAAEYRVLSLYCPETSSATPWVGAVEKYLVDALGEEVDLGNDLPTLDRALQLAVAKWLVKTLPEEERQSASAAKRWIEMNAPAPLLPFYFWIGLDGCPKTYLVCPIWTSILYPTAVRLAKDEKQTPIVGLALCGVAPLSAWDSTLTTNLKSGDFGVRNTANRDVIELIGLLAQPAVELNFYRPLADELERVERARITARHVYVLRRGLIHETGQLVHLVRGFADGLLTKPEVSAECTVVKLASNALAKILGDESQVCEELCHVVVDNVKAALSWNDLVLVWKIPPPLKGSPVPAALEYVLIELGRNAYNACTRDSDGRKTVYMTLTKSDEADCIHNVSVRQSGQLNRPAIDTDVDSLPLNPEHGLEVVPYIVKEIIRGRFVLQQEEGDVLAYVDCPRRAQDG